MSMYRLPLTDEAFARNSDPSTREERWGSTIKKIEDSFANSVEADARSMVLRGATAGNANATTNDYFSVLSAPGTSFYKPLVVGSSLFSKRTFSDWIRLQKLNATGESSAESKRYFERAVRIINSLVLKIVVTDVKDGKTEYELGMDPKLLTAENIMVHQSAEDGETAHFVQSETDENESSSRDAAVMKYSAMKALGIICYDLLTRGMGPPIASFLPSTVTDRAGETRLLLSLDDYSLPSTPTRPLDDRNQSKRSRSDVNKGRIASAMVDVGVPFPLCRFVIDLLGGESSDGLIFRSDNSFQSFTDVLADLKQMMKNPEAFIHLSIKDQWRQAFDKMHGRKDEKAAIMGAAWRVTGITSNDALFEALALLLPQNKQQVVMVTGQPGAGKSRLVMETSKSLKNQGWLFLSCKFNCIIHSEPLSIMAGAFDDFLEECLGNSRRDQIRSNLKKLMLPADVSILTKHVPCLAKYVDECILPPDDFETSKEQMHELFCQLLKVLSVFGQPIAFFCDDLQWGDFTSIDLLNALVRAGEPDLSSSTDSDANKKSKFLLIGSYRDNEVDDNHHLVQLLHQLKDNSSVEVTDVSVGGFDQDTMNQVVSESLCLPLRRTKSLSEIILQKTGGIVIHMIEFIGRLTTEKILCHSLLKGWEWDSEVIEGYPMSESVAELFTLKLKTLPADSLRALQICSIFGIQIEQRLIDFLKDVDGEETVDINVGLKVAVDLGLIEMSGSTEAKVFKFPHDLIAQATFDLILDAERPQLLQNLASALIRNASAADEMDHVVFVTVDLVNRIRNDAMIDSKKRVVYASLNDEASRKALAVSDFSSAVKYCESGLCFLGSSHWEDEHDLSIRLYTTSIAALYSCTGGNQDLLKKRIDLVFQHARNVDEEFKTRYVWIRLLASTSLQTAIDECHKLLETLGEPIDSSNEKLALVPSELVRVKKSFFEHKHQFLKMNRMVDRNKLNAMKILSSLAVFYHYKRSLTGGLVCSKMVELSMLHGHCEESLFGLASFAVFLTTILGDIDEASSLARTVLASLSKSHHHVNALVPAVYAAVYGLILVWKEPMQATFDPLLHGCRLAFAYGDMQFAVGNAQMYILRSFVSGKEIDALLSEIELLAQKCARHGQIPFVQHLLTPVYNILRDLRGLQPQALAPLEQYIDNEELLSLQFYQTDHIGFELQLLVSIALSFWLRDFEKAQRIADMFTDVSYNMKMRLTITHVFLKFYIGLTACHFGRANQDTAWKVKVEKALNLIELLSSHSTWNFENKLLLLKAELHYTEGEVYEAAKCYQSSITSAKNHKFVHEEAVACELAGYFFKEQGDETKSNAMFKQARDAYIKWGATHKANSLPR